MPDRAGQALRRRFAGESGNGLVTQRKAVRLRTSPDPFPAVALRLERTLHGIAQADISSEPPSSADEILERYRQVPEKSVDQPVPLVSNSR